MGIASQEPGRIGFRAAATWKYLDVPCSGSVGAFVAGKPLGVYCHTVVKKSKPCRLITTDGKLPCALCAKGDPTWRGYTPLYDSEYTWRFVVITKEYRESVLELSRFAQVKVSRGKKVTDCVIIRPTNWRTLPIPANAEREAEPDLIPSLLTLWGDDELAAWHYSSDIPVSIAPVPGGARRGPPLPPEEEAELMDAAIRSRLHWPGKDEPGAPGPKLVGDVLNESPKPNGKHKPR